MNNNPEALCIYQVKFRTRQGSTVRGLFLICILNDCMRGDKINYSISHYLRGV